MKFIFGVIVGVALIFALNFFGVVELEWGKILSEKNNLPVAPEELISGAEKFGSLKVVITSGGAFVSGVEVDVGERPGGKMAVAITDRNGAAFFEKMPVGNFVIFFNDSTFPKNFQKVANLIPVRVFQDETVEQKIELKPAL